MQNLHRPSDGICDKLEGARIHRTLCRTDSKFPLPPFEKLTITHTCARLSPFAKLQISGATPFLGRGLNGNET